MDILKILGTIWMYVYPVLLVSTLLVVILNVVGYKHERIHQYGIFSKIFVSLMIASFIYYLYDALPRSNKGFIELAQGFYEWAIYLAFYFLIISLIGTALFIFFKKQ
ncbi:hypothetical protein LS482_09755 [Sinomicrobium kalidii]|uniref:hypothetical protein n=1 Tax=Sinomicrobium kalidii TaxID=2900738 RepID=UPI001E292235|nr:hypothetical protein [Sinomicrobium kalidii]UGU18152.1 hypothetical protein LS482_09755 [Sinomicrobium kalidii]